MAVSRPNMQTASGGRTLPCVAPGTTSTLVPGVPEERNPRSAIRVALSFPMGVRMGFRVVRG
eukprot:8965525-Alexandrium_andersonii.AAC.1